MKKIIAFILIVVMCLTLLTSCMYLESAALGGLLWLWAKSEREIVARNVFFDDELIIEHREE